MGNLDVRQVDLERGMPPVDQALKLMAFELRRSRGLGYGAVKLIHGDGSSGKGGRIRVQARAQLGRMAARGEVQGVIFGESFSIFDEATRRAFDRCPALRRDSDLERHNNGITIVLL